MVDTETATVSGNGAYATSTGYTATAPGTYQWSASYGGRYRTMQVGDRPAVDGEQVIVGQASADADDGGKPVRARREVTDCRTARR